MLTEALAGVFARTALANIEREYAAQMHWLLLRVLRLYPMLPESGRIAARLDAGLGDFGANRTFERPYGWAWLLELQAEALRAKSRWSRALEPLAVELAQAMGDFVSQSPDPIRAGGRFNSAFACILALDYARASADLPLELEVRKAARRWYGSDRDAPLASEPARDDFLSSSLVEALLMKQLLDAAEFGAWLNRFFPEGVGPIAALPVVAERAGLCLSRAWCFAGLGLHEIAAKHIAAALPRVVEGDFVGEPGLASFAVLALSGLPTAGAQRTP